MFAAESIAVTAIPLLFLMRLVTARKLKGRLVLMTTEQGIRPVLVRRIIKGSMGVRSFMLLLADLFVKQPMRIIAVIGHRCRLLMVVKPISLIVHQNVRKLMPITAVIGIIMIMDMGVSNITAIANLNVRLL